MPGEYIKKVTFEANDGRKFRAVMRQIFKETHALSYRFLIGIHLLLDDNTLDRTIGLHAAIFNVTIEQGERFFNEKIEAVKSGYVLRY